jgi:hypothetical protein
LRFWVKRMRLLVIVCLVGLATAADFQKAKIVDVQPYTEQHAPIIAPNNGYPVLIDTSSKMFTLTLAVGDMNYSGNYRSGRHLKSSDLIVGDTIEACIDGDKMIVRRQDGKEVQAKITRRARIK